MNYSDFRLVVEEWCEAQKDLELDYWPANLPTYKRAHRLYHAGRAVYGAVCIDPGPGRYEYNDYFEHPGPPEKKLLNE